MAGQENTSVRSPAVEEILESVRDALRPLAFHAAELVESITESRESGRPLTHEQAQPSRPLNRNGGAQ